MVLPALHAVDERLGYVPPEAVVEIAELLELAPADVQDALSFYGFFAQDRPQGQVRIWVCRSLELRGPRRRGDARLPVREARHPAGPDHARRPRDRPLRRVPRGLRLRPRHARRRRAL